MALIPRSPKQDKALAYLLATKYGFTQNDIAQRLKKSQSTISMWIKEASYLIQTGQLNDEIQQAEKEIYNLKN